MTKFRDTGESLRKRSSHKHPEQAAILADLEKEPTKRLAINMPVSTHTELKKFAADEGRGMAAIVLELIHAHLHKSTKAP